MRLKVDCIWFNIALASAGPGCLANWGLRISGAGEEGELTRRSRGAALLACRAGALTVRTLLLVDTERRAGAAGLTVGAVARVVRTCCLATRSGRGDGPVLTVLGADACCGAAGVTLTERAVEACGVTDEGMIAAGRESKALARATGRMDAL